MPRLVNEYKPIKTVYRVHGFPYGKTEYVTHYHYRLNGLITYHSKKAIKILVWDEKGNPKLFKFTPDDSPFFHYILRDIKFGSFVKVVFYESPNNFTTALNDIYLRQDINHDHL